MEVKKVNDKNIWEDFFRRQKEKTFLQSWNWGEFQQRMGNKIWRLGVFNDEGGLASVCLVVKVEAKRGKFLLIQHGLGISEVLLNKLKEIAREEDCSFIRIAPLLERTEENVKLFRNLGFREAPMHANAYEATWKLDLTPSEDDLLMNLRKTTRYLIRQTLKNQDVVVEKSEKLDDVRIYQELNREIAKRQRFVPFSSEYIKNEFEVFSPDGQVLLFSGKYKGEIAAAALIVFWSGIGFYHQAASREKYAKLSIPYLLQWEAIKEAKSRGCRFYDFWGFVDPKENPKHPWAGPTLFKMGFGGQAHQYLKTQDLPLSKKYWLTFVFEKLRKAKRTL
jgi:lipid II:glycine glycyltransferase (peptidoglycan interpeptide bridge formation enzyme)